MNYVSSVLFSFSLLIFGALGPSALAQKTDPFTTGNLYILAYPDTTTNTFDARYPNPMADTILVMIYSAVNNQVSITGNGYTRSVTLQAGKLSLVYLNDSRNRATAPIVKESGMVSRNVFRLEAKEPVIVYCYIVTKFGGEAWTPLPVETWGKEYFAASFPGEVLKDVSPGGELDYRSNKKMGPAEITIVSAFDSTQVTIYPAGQLYNYPSTTVTLKANEAYQVQSFVDTLTESDGDIDGIKQPDIAGTRIVASKHVGVLSGNTRAQLRDEATIPGLARNSFKNMAIEWLAPIEQHGHEFVFMPTWDDLRILGTPNEKLEDKRPGELVRIYRTRAGKTRGTTISAGVSSQFTIDQNYHRFDSVERRLFQDKRPLPVATVYRTDSAAQAFMAPMSVVKWNSTNGGGTFGSTSANSWGTYMVEMVPREQWSSFAPYYAPPHPAQMNHHINIVTDTASMMKIYREDGTRVVFGNGVIPGTDLVWAHIGVSPGIDHYFEGRDGARFFAYAYGLWRGFEMHRPGKAGKHDDPDLASGGRGREEVLHPSDYEENTAVAYGYPLAPRRRVLRSGDSLAIDTSMNCTELRIAIRVLGPNPVGFRSITLDPGQTVSFNAKLVPVDPAKLTDILGKSKCTVKVVPIDPLENAQATVIIKDRTGKTWRVYYRYEAEWVNLDTGDILNFGEVTLGEIKDLIVTVTNPLTRAIRVVGLRTHLGLGKGFEIIDPKLDADDTITLASGAKLDIKIRFSPTQENKLYEDTLIVQMGCSQVKQPLRGEAINPCVYVDDLAFGTFVIGMDSAKTLPLEICNTGRGNISFLNPSGGPVLRWLNTSNFSIPQRTLDSLRDHVVLGPNSCYVIDVTLTPTAPGRFHDTVQFHTSTDCELDISIWSAEIQEIPPGEACLYIDNFVNFAPAQLGDAMSWAPLGLINSGGGLLSFRNPNGGRVIEWDTTSGFEIPLSVLDSLRHVRLRPNQSVTVWVGFRSEQPGEFSTSAKIWSNVECGSDSSLWRIRIVDTATLGADDVEGVSGSRLRAITPNPSNERAAIDYTLGSRGQTSVTIVNAAGEEVARLVDGQMEPGEHRVEWDAGRYPAGIYFCRLQCGGVGDILPVVIVK